MNCMGSCPHGLPYESSLQRVGTKSGLYMDYVLDYGLDYGLNYMDSIEQQIVFYLLKTS